MDNKYIKKILILLYGIVIIGLFAFFFLEQLLFPDVIESIEATQYLMSAVSLQLGMLTAWMFGNNNKKK